MIDSRRPGEISLDRFDGEEQIRSALSGLRFGSVEITIHDGRIVLVERRKKVRLHPDSMAGKR
jgi:hypothetical protein